MSGHAGVGSAGAALSAAGGSGDPWSTALPGAYGAGTAGFIIGTNIDATISSRSTLTQAQVTGGAYALDTDANGRIRIVDGTAAGELDTNAGKVLLAATQVFDNTGTWTGNITGSLSGSVGSVAGAVGSIATGGIAAASIAVAAAEKLADISRRRTQANVEASAFGDAVSKGSLYGIIQMLQESNTVDNPGFLTVYKTDGSTELGQIAITTDAAAEPITGVA